MSSPASTLQPAASHRSTFRAVLTPRWVLTTLLVLVASAVMIRLGIWQLDRLEQRKARNAQYTAVMALPPLVLNSLLPDADLQSQTYRDAEVTGMYDFSGEVILRNQVWEDRPGYHLLTPLRIQGSDQAVMVDRGWIPLEDGSPEKRAAYAQTGSVTVRGRLMPQHTPTSLGGAVDPQLQPGQTRLDAWNWINLERLNQQSSAPLLTVYLLAAPESDNPLPHRSIPPIELDEGPHFGYAMQWFIFALILLTGYPFYVRSQLRQTN